MSPEDVRHIFGRLPKTSPGARTEEVRFGTIPNTPVDVTIIK
jgi:hypothetical protein